MNPVPDKYKNVTVTLEIARLTSNGITVSASIKDFPSMDAAVDHIVQITGADRETALDDLQKYGWFDTEFYGFTDISWEG